jgi:hypothetical protein
MAMVLGIDALMEKLPKEARMELHDILKVMEDITCQSARSNVRNTSDQPTLHERRVEVARRYNELLTRVGEVELLNLNHAGGLHIEISDLIFEKLGFPRTAAV